jgi:hypothetical protein
MTKRSPTAKRGPGRPTGPRKPAIGHVIKRQDRRRAVEQSRAETTQHRPEGQQPPTRRSQLQDRLDEAIADLVQSVVPWQARVEKQARRWAKIARATRSADQRQAIETRLRLVVAGDVDEPVAEPIGAADAHALRQRFERLTALLGDWLDDFAGGLPAEPLSVFLDRIAPGEHGLLSRARKLQRDLEVLERRAASLADDANSDVPQGRPTRLPSDTAVLWLAEVWQIQTGEFPHQAKDDAEGGDKGAFAAWATATLLKLSPEMAIASRPHSEGNRLSKAPILNALRRLTARKKPRRGDLNMLPSRAR